MNKGDCMNEHIAEIKAELSRAKKKHPYFPKDLIHMVSVMNEESGETIRAALNYTYEKGDLQEVWLETIQTAAMCLRIMENIETLVIEEKDNQRKLF